MGLYFTVKRNISDNLDSTRIEALEEISMIEGPNHKKDPPKSAKKTPRSIKKKPTEAPKTKPLLKSSTKKALVGKQASPSVINKAAVQMDESSILQRPRRNIVRKQLVIASSDDEDDEDKENAFEDSGSDWSHSEGSCKSNLMTDDDSVSDESISTQRTKGSKMNAKTATAKKRNKNRLTYLNLSEQEVVEVDDDARTEASEEDLANITRRFLEADLNDDEE